MASIRNTSALALFAALSGCTVFGSRVSRYDLLPSDAETKLANAERLVAERKEDEALAILSKLREAFPESVRVHREYQDARCRMGDEEAVREEYRERTFQRGDALSYLLYARLLADPPARRSQIEIAISRDPSLPWAYVAR